MRLLCQVIFELLVILVSLFSTIFGVMIAMSPNSDGKPEKIAVTIFVSALAIMLARWIWGVIEKDRLIKLVVMDVVGIMPDQIDDWKWREAAWPRVENKLRSLALRIRDLDKSR